MKTIIGGPGIPRPMSSQSDSLDAEIDRLETEIREKKAELHELRREQPRESVESHPLVDWNGEEVDISDLFGDRDDLIVIHNMGRSCPYCTLWADAFDGVIEHIQDRASFALVSPDDPAVQQEFAAQRDWSFDMYSDQQGTFTEDAGFTDGDRLVPGISTYERTEDGTIRRVASATFGPNDEFEPVWPLFELLADGPTDWKPQKWY